MDEEFAAWHKHRDPITLAKLLDAAKPTLQSALTSYAGGDHSLMGRAKIMAAKSLERFDPDRGVKLQTYLMSQLQPLSRESVRRRQAVRVPEKANIDLWRVNQATQEFRDAHEREPADTELADATGLSHRRILKLRKYGKGEISEGSMQSVNDDGEVSNFQPGGQTKDPELVWAEYVHHDLGPVDQKILEHRTGLFGNDILPNQDIAKKLNLSPGAISQRAAKIQAKLQEYHGPKPAAADAPFVSSFPGGPPNEQGGL